MFTSPVTNLAAVVAIRNLKAGGGGGDPPPENPKSAKWLIGIAVALFLSSIGVFGFTDHPLIAIILAGSALTVLVIAVLAFI